MANALGRYVLDRRIAVGGMGEVHLARQTGPDGFERVCVVKTMHEAVASDPEFVNLFLEEARLSARLTHPNVAQIYDFGKVDDTYYLALEYVDGTSVREIIRGQRKRQAFLDVGLALRIASQTAQALDYVHRQTGPDGKPLNLVHRDISPGNLLLSKDGVVKVIDFGIAKARTTQRQTQVGTVRGKLAYIAPEQMFSLPVDGRADVFSLGLVLYELLALRRALRGKTDLELIENAKTWNIEPLTKLRQGLPPAVTALVTKATRRDKADRFQTASEFADACEAAIAGAHLVVAPSDLRKLATEFADLPPPDGVVEPHTPSGNASPAGAKVTPGRPSAPRPPAAGAADARARPSGSKPAQPPSTATNPAIPRAINTEVSAAHRPADAPVDRDHETVPTQPEGKPSPVFGGAAAIDAPEPSITAPAVVPRGTETTSPELESVGGDAPPAAPADRTVIAAYPGPPRKKWPVPLIAAALGALVLLGGGAAWVLSGDTPAEGPDQPAPITVPKKADAPPPTPAPVDVPTPPPVDAVPPAPTDDSAAMGVARGDDVLPPDDLAAGDDDLAPLDDTEPGAADDDATAGTDTDAAAETAPKKKVVLGVLEVLSDQKLEVFVDGKLQGTTPKKLKVKVGTRRVTWRAKKLGLRHDAKVRVAESTPAKAEWLPKHGQVEVRAVPPHVELQVSLDGKAVGVTPLPALEVWEGAHVIAVKNAASGWRAQQKVVVPPGGKLRLKGNDGSGITVSDK